MSLEVHHHGPGDGDGPDDDRPAFRFDFADPRDYLIAEVGPRDVEWIPARRPAGAPPPTLDGLAEQLAEHELQGLRAPTPFPFDSEKALLAATYAKQIGRAVAFSLAAFRQCYAAGRSLEDVDTILIAAAACEMHPRAVLQALERDSVKRALDEASAAR